MPDSVTNLRVIAGSTLKSSLILWDPPKDKNTQRYLTEYEVLCCTNSSDTEAYNYKRFKIKLRRDVRSVELELLPGVPYRVEVHVHLKHLTGKPALIFVTTGKEKI